MSNHANLLKRTQDERQRLLAEYRAYDQLAGDRPSAEEQRHLADMSARLDDLGRQINAGIEAVAQESRMIEAVASMPGSGATHRGLDPQFSEWARRAKPGDSTELRSAFKALETRSLVVGTPSAGGRLVPTSLASLIEAKVDQGALLQAGVTVLATTSGERINVPVQGAISTWAAVSEAVAIGVSEPALAASVELDAYKYGARGAVSNELLADANFDAAAWVGRQLGTGAQVLVDSKCVSGTGTGEPHGVAVATTVGKTSASSTAVTADEIIDTFYSLSTPYRAGAAWLFNDATIAEVRKLKEATTGNYLWAPGFAGTPDTILGKPVYTSPSMPGLGAGNVVAVFGDFASYVVRFAGGIRVEYSQDFHFDTDQTAFRGLLRLDGALVDSAGLRSLRCKP